MKPIYFDCFFESITLTKCVFTTETGAARQQHFGTLSRPRADIAFEGHFCMPGCSSSNSAFTGRVASEKHSSGSWIQDFGQALQLEVMMMITASLIMTRMLNGICNSPISHCGSCHWFITRHQQHLNRGESNEDTPWAQTNCLGGLLKPIHDASIPHIRHSAFNLCDERQFQCCRCCAR